MYSPGIASSSTHPQTGRWGFKMGKEADSLRMMCKEEYMYMYLHISSPDASSGQMDHL